MKTTALSGDAIARNFLRENKSRRFDDFAALVSNANKLAAMPFPGAPICTAPACPAIVVWAWGRSIDCLYKLNAGYCFSVMKQFEPRHCIDCHEEYIPTSSNQKRCIHCRTWGLPRLHVLLYPEIQAILADGAWHAIQEIRERLSKKVSGAFFTSLVKKKLIVRHPDTIRPKYRKS
jgi:hypothetical protein